jgi:hypothetical protein
MKFQELKNRLKKERPMKNIELEMPEDVVEDLRKISLHLGFSNSEALMRAYIGQGLQTDLQRFANTEISTFIESLRRNGVKDEVISVALSDLQKVV